MVDVKGNARITDFGLATIVRDPSSFADDDDDHGFTPRWTAPEVLQAGMFTGGTSKSSKGPGKTAKESGKPTKESDVFSFGMVVIEVWGDLSVYIGRLIH
jgi:serine/threonine protein kinase